MYAKADHSNQASHDASRSGISSRQPGSGTATGRISYRSAITRHNPPESDHVYYDGGELSPYCLESMVDLLRAEARLPYTTLDVDLEIAGPCPAARVREVSVRFSDLPIRGLRVLLRAEGHGTLVIAPKVHGS